MKNRIAVPRVDSLRALILSECHDSRFAGHMGKDKTLELVKRLFYWPGMTQDVTDYVASCHICQTCKPSNTKSQGLLKVPEIIDRPWAYISMDLITGLPLTADGHNAIITVVDRCTKMVHLITTTDTVGAEQLYELLENHVFKLHGLCSDVIHDRDPRFT